ncbi:GNAT family N-acetyltransferase [Paraoerskovia marina]|uniref:GNAT family N-acetyltransferase n=1 Tax=Paraoerskovia marina TaxID=545619 RepID=UPI0005B8A2B2|nr:GNAT family N-acetyltransferase [Paraoerskovia marina]
MSDRPALRPATEADVAALVELNNAAYPAVPTMSAEEIRDLLAVADASLVGVDPAEPETPRALLVLVTPGAAYASENYAWFEEREASHLYVDRIVVAEDARNQGWGAALYEAAFAAAADRGLAVVTCEVNLDPPNPGSLRFHHRLGFERVGEQITKGGTVTVEMLRADAGRGEASAAE